jgi:hypothetical protein
MRKRCGVCPLLKPEARWRCLLRNPGFPDLLGSVRGTGMRPPASGRCPGALGGGKDSTPPVLRA